jgi:alkylhydroperoxidase/carboxymuconolactone decarboxylase family protein YurZ
MGHAIIARPTHRLWTLLVTQWFQSTNFRGDDMSDDDRATQAEQLIARMKAARGYIYPEWELAARTDPEFTDAYNRIYELALGEGRQVSAKVREFVAIALLAFRGADREGLVAHMQRAMRLGATKEELFEALEATLVPGGAPTFHRGLSALLEIEEG